MRCLPAVAISALSIMALPAAQAQAQPQAPSAAGIGVIDFQRAVVETAEFEKAYNAIQAKYKPEQDRVEQAQQELADLQTQLRAAAGQLSSSGQAELEDRGARKQREVERLSEDLQLNFERERDDALRLTSTRMQEVLKSLADQMGLDVIVDQSTAPYFREALDVTDEAITAYDAAYPAN